MYGLNEDEIKILKKLDTPHKIQDFLNSMPKNFEENRETCMSPRKVLREKKCHCIEGAMLAYVAFLVNNKKGFLLDLMANKNDFDHVVLVFKENGKWGAISKTNQSVLRYRDPLYKTIRELVMSYFNEYIDKNGNKTLRSYTKPVDLKDLGYNWITSEKDVWEVPYKLVDTKHIQILNKSEIKNLRKVDKIEIDANRLNEWKPN